jgi:hypothetical protein
LTVREDAGEGAPKRAGVFLRVHGWDSGEGAQS